MKRFLGLLLEQLVSVSKSLKLEKCWKQKKLKSRRTAVSDRKWLMDSHSSFRHFGFWLFNADTGS